MQRTGWSMAARIGFLAAVAAVLALAGPVPAMVRADPKASDGEERTLRTADGLPLRITYYKSPADKESPVVVLLHMKGGNRFVWQTDGGFAKRLNAEGYAVITVDLRFHGESKVAGGVGVGNVNQGAAKKSKGKKSGPDLMPGDYKDMVGLDMEAVKEFIFEEHKAGNLNMNKMGIVGPEMGASVAAYYAVLDWDKAPYEDGQEGFRTPRGQDVRALVLISPENKFPGLMMAEVIPALKDPDKHIAILICSGSDPKDKAQSEKIYDLVSQPAAVNKKRMYFKSYGAKLTGTDLLEKRLPLEDHMLAFFNEHVKKIDSQWRDRRSKRERLETKKK